MRRRIASVIAPIDRVRNPIPHGRFTYIDLGSIDADTKAIESPKFIPVAEAPSRARQIVRTGDVLVSTVRPNLNGVAFVESEFDLAIASTGFTVLRARHDAVDPRYLFHWVRSRAFVDDMVRKATGASYPAVSDAIVHESELPLPPLPEQRRIAAILDQADKIRTARRRGLELNRALSARMFESEFAAAQAKATLADAVESLVGGRNIVGAEDSPNAHRVLKISAVTSGAYIESESKPLPAGYVPPSEHLVRSGDILISRANTAPLVGASALVHETIGTLALPDKLWRATPREGVHPRYLLAALQSRAVRSEISSRATGTGGSMKNISKPKLLAVPVHLPSAAVQHDFVERLQTVEAQRSLSQRQLTKLDSLFASLQHRAFRGEL